MFYVFYLFVNVMLIGMAKLMRTANFSHKIPSRSLVDRYRVIIYLSIALNSLIYQMKEMQGQQYTCIPRSSNIALNCYERLQGLVV